LASLASIINLSPAVSMPGSGGRGTIQWGDSPGIYSVREKEFEKITNRARHGNSYLERIPAS
jgi:hypothetical protein